MGGISIVTGTLNRRPLLPLLLSNTVNADTRLELILVDGGSTDGTIEYIKSLAHPRIKLIEVGRRSSYAHFMNLGVRGATQEYICQWNDDAFLVNSWDEVFSCIDKSMVYIFSWKEDKYPGFKDKKWKILNEKKKDENGDIVVNYGLYHKDVFRKIGLYNTAYHFYYTDADMAQRAWYFGFSVKNCNTIKVVALQGIHKYGSLSDTMEKDRETYEKHSGLYSKKILPDNLEYLS